ncbi:polyprenyl synthetase family protein [Polymorphospora rubra]|uniref:polyprenyl synthetase family protein n=1 Tax=Polymorphospora rubra TaxID=338584 RepID=UPI00340CD0B9
MTIVASTDPLDFTGKLSASHSGRLLRDRLGQRWPESSDRLSAMVRHALLPAGKLIRPIMALESASAAGGRPEPVLPAALGLEYLHVATLVHDDIIDGDTTRRGRPTVSAAYGTPDAIVTGDALIFTAYTAIVECRAGGVPADRIVAAVDALSEAGSDLCRGQVLEAGLAGDPTGPATTYLEMVRLKTGALFRAVCQIGALLGGADAERGRLLAGYGESVGIAFQIRDDLLAYTSDAAAIGKSTTSDLTNGRPTLPVLLAHQVGGPAQRRQLVEALTRGHADPAALAGVCEIVRDTGALAAAREVAAEHAGRAHKRLSTLDESAARDTLAAIAGWAAVPG